MWRSAAPRQLQGHKLLEAGRRSKSGGPGPAPRGPGPGAPAKRAAPAKKPAPAKEAPSPPRVPPPAPKNYIGGLFNLFTFTAIGASGVVGYSWWDLKFRKQVESNVPYSKLLLDKALGPIESARGYTKTFKTEPVVERLETIAPALDPVPPKMEPINLSSKEITEETPKETPTEVVVPDEKEKPKDLVAESIITQREIEKAMISKEDAEKAENAALEQRIAALVASSESLALQALKAQATVEECTRSHTQLLKQAMDDTSQILKKDDQWEAVASAFKEKEIAVFLSEELKEDTQKTIDQLRDILAESKKSKVTKKNPAIHSATKKVAELTSSLGSAAAKVRKAESEARVMLKYKSLVDKGRKQFKEELEALMPDVRIGNTSKKLTEDELNALIAHAHRRIEQLQKQLAEQAALEATRLAQALEAERGEGTVLALQAVEDERKRLQAEWETEKHKQELEFLVQQEAEVRRQLARQAGAHSDHIRDVLAVQREQLGLDYTRTLNAKILEERENFQAEVASLISRTRGIERAIDERASSEQLARAAQDLWLACIALNSQLMGDDGSDPTTLTPIRREVDTLINVGRKHPFVEAVAGGIPAAALERGVFTEEQLKSRFDRVARVCRKLALVKGESAGLLDYLVSRVTNAFVFNNVAASSASDQLDVSALDNYELLDTAGHFMQQGDLESCLRLMCQLSGEAGRAASDWVGEARLLLETRQAAHSLTAYASATGLAHTF